jgi:hypothetical protein
MKVISKAVLVGVMVLLTAIAVWADVHCFNHSWANCWSIGEVKVLPDGGIATKYQCACGDYMWVR